MTAKTKNEGALGTYTDIFCTACALCLYSAMPPIVEDRNGPLEADRLMAVGLNRAMDTKIKPVMLTPLQQKRVWETFRCRSAKSISPTSRVATPVKRGGRVVHLADVLRSG